MIVRKAETRDLDSLLELYRELDSYHTENLPGVIKNIDDSFRRQIILEALDNDDYIFAAAEEDGRVVGLIMGLFKEISDHPVMADKRYLNIFDIIVDKRYRRRGIASKLMEYAENRAREMKLDYIELQVYEFNDAVKFYEHSGFETTVKRMQKNLTTIQKGSPPPL